MGRGADAVHAERVLKVISGSDAASSALAASWRRSGRLHALDPASRTLPQRLRQPRSPRRRTSSGRCCGSPRPASIGCLSPLAASAVRCSSRTGAVSWSTGGARPATSRLRRVGLGPAPCGARRSRAPTASGPASSSSAPDHRPRPAFLHPQRTPELHDRADLRRARRAGRGARRFLLPRRPHRRLRPADRDRSRGCGARDRSGELPSCFSGGADLLPPAGERAGMSLIAVEDGDLVVGATRAARLASASAWRSSQGRCRPPI